MQLKLFVDRPFCFSSSCVARVRTVYFPRIFPAPSFSRAFKFVLSTKTAPYCHQTSLALLVILGVQLLYVFYYFCKFLKLPTAEMNVSFVRKKTPINFK